MHNYVETYQLHKSQFVAHRRQRVRDWSGILCERISGTRFGDGDEVTELVEVPRSYFGKRDGNIASKDIAESPTRSGTPK